MSWPIFLYWYTSPGDGLVNILVLVCASKIMDLWIFLYLYTFPRWWTCEYAHVVRVHWVNGWTVVILRYTLVDSLQLEAETTIPCPGSLTERFLRNPLSVTGPFICHINVLSRVMTGILVYLSKAALILFAVPRLCQLNYILSVYFCCQLLSNREMKIIRLVSITGSIFLQQVSSDQYLNDVYLTAECA